MTVRAGGCKGKARIGLTIAGFGLEFESDSAGIISVLSKRYGRFAARRGLYRFRAEEAPARQSPFKPGVLLKGGALTLARGDFRAELDLRSGKGCLAAAPKEQTLDAFLRSLVSALLLRSGGLVLHSAGLVKNGKAYLFPGRSGAGKSTLSKLAAAAGAVVISDEINLVRREGARFFVYGSPFWGEMRADGRPGRWPLGGVLLPKKARANRLRPCTPGKLLKTLLRCLLNFEKGQAISGLALRGAAGLAVKAAAGELEFSKKDAAFLELI